MVLQAWPSINSEHGIPSLVRVGKRHIFAMMTFTGICLAYAIRFNLSIVIVVMINSTHTQTAEIDVDFDSQELLETKIAKVGQKSETCPVPKISSNRTNPLDGKTGHLNWDESTVGLALGSFFWGYAITMFPGGLIAQRFGGKWPFGISLIVSGIAGLFIPLSSYAGPYFLTAIRIIQGLFGGLSFSASHALIAKWIPPKQRGKYATFIYAGMPFGSAATMVISGYIAHYLGWATVFYITGAIVFVWTCLWFWLIYETPGEHPTISDEEFKLIETSMADQGIRSATRLHTPWKEIFKSVPVWAIIITQPCSTWGYYTLLILLPTYLKTALHFDLRSNSWISALPHFFSWGMSIVVVQIGDILQNRDIISTGTVRKINTSITLWGSAICLIGVAFAGCDYKLAVGLLVLAVGCTGAMYGGIFCNHIDIAPNFAGLLLGITNTLSAMPGFISPSIAGYILQGNPSVGQWKKIFYLGAVIHIIGNIFYLLFGSGELQPWNNGRKSSMNAIDVMT